MSDDEVTFVDSYRLLDTLRHPRWVISACVGDGDAFEISVVIATRPKRKGA
jgi:hypothetical protein